MAMTQMNVRIDEQLRIEGNAALESIGISPAQMVRAVWSYAARNKNNPLKLEHDLKFLEEDKPLSEEVQRKLDLIAEGQRIVADFYKEMGITPGEIDPLPYDELKELAYRERWEDRGLL